MLWTLFKLYDVKTFFQVLKYCGSGASNLVDLVGSEWGVGSPALDWRRPTLGRLRACVEAVLTWQLVKAQCYSLKQKKLHRIYKGTVHKIRICLLYKLRYADTKLEVLTVVKMLMLKMAVFWVVVPCRLV
jgi:hypothetical protein